MINLKALALTALAATTLTFAAPKAQASLNPCANTAGFPMRCVDANGTEFANHMAWKNAQGNAAQATAVITHILTTPAYETAVPTTNVDRDCFINGQAYCIDGPQTNQW